MTLFLVLAAVAAGWCVQLFLTYRQSKVFTEWTRILRSKGVVSVGKGGRRYRGGVAFVAIAVDPRGLVVDALTLRGFTTFARPAHLDAVQGTHIGTLAGTREVRGLRPNEREAVRQAATFVKAQLAAAAAPRAVPVTPPAITEKAPVAG